MKTIGIFEAKTRLSEVCDEVAESGQPVVVTRRGKPLVRILPVDDQRASILERRQAYMATYAREETDDSTDFEVTRSGEVSTFEIGT